MSELSYTAESSVNPAVDTILACPFDLVARAELAVEGCTRLSNAARDGQPYSYAEFHTEPPVALHAPWDYADSAGRLLEALTYAKIMTGTAPDERDLAYASILAACQQEDGLIHLPPSPWTHDEPIIEMEWSQRGALLAWTARYLAMEDQDAIERAERLVRGLFKSAVWEGEICWFPASVKPLRGWLNRLPPPAGPREILIGAQVLFPLARFAEATGSREALQLAHGLTRFTLERTGAFDERAQLTDSAAKYLHSNTSFIHGVLKYGVVSGRSAYVDWAHAAFENVRAFGTDFGFFPHRTSGPDRWRGDLCTTVDMMEIAMQLAIHKDASYFAVAEQYGRNHLIESQILDLTWVKQSTATPFCQDMWCARYPPEGVTTEDVCERALGAFAGWSQFNDAFDPNNPRLILRSSGAGTRGLYDLWHYAVSRPEGAVRVNLHFSRDTRWATVTSLTPQDGAIEVLMKTRGVLAVRVPLGLTEKDVAVTVNGNPRHETLRGTYAWLEALMPGDLIVVKWPQFNRADKYDMNGTEVTGNWHGDTLFWMDPPGQLTPLYNRPVEVAGAPPKGPAAGIREIDSL